MVSSPVRNEHEARVVRMGQALSHPLRVRVLGLLVQGDSFRVGVLARRFHVALPLMKQHLQRLCAAGLVLAERRGEAVWYRIAADAAVRPLRALFQDSSPVPDAAANDGCAPEAVDDGGRDAPSG